MINNIKIVTYKLEESFYSYLIELFKYESIDIINVKSIDDCNSHFLNENIYLFIIDCCINEIIELIMLSKSNDLFRPIIILKKGECEIKTKLYQMGINAIFDYGVEEENFFNQALNFITLYQAKKDSKSQISVLKTLSTALEIRDYYTHGHGERLVIFASTLYDELGFKDFEEREALRAAAIIHDVGKIGTPDNILKSSNKLTDEDFEIVKKHPEDGVKICLKIISDSRVIDIIQHHHEKLDGTGYPHGLKKNNINILVQILTICDIYDALTSDRSYRIRNNQDEAIKIMDEEFKYKINPDYYLKFKELLKLNKFIGLKYI